MGDELNKDKRTKAELLRQAKKIRATSEKEYLKELKRKSSGFLVDNLSLFERERIASYICGRIREALPKHRDLEEKIDGYDEVYRMQRTELAGAESSTPNYRTPLTTVTSEVVHAYIMNVFFTPNDIVRVLPVEEGDIPKVKKLTNFANWSAKNELSIFEQCDRMFHNSAKTGECPYLVHWVKEYGIDIEREQVDDPDNPGSPLYDPDTQQPVFQEKEVVKLLYNGPKLEIFSRKDYIQPEHAIMDKTPPWEAVRHRITFDEYLREELSGHMYPMTIEDITDWMDASVVGTDGKVDYDGNVIPTGHNEKVFYQWYGRMRINMVKADDGRGPGGSGNENPLETSELEDEFIALVNLEDQVLCQLRYNRFPLKMRPIGIDHFMPDDEGRRHGTGIVEFMEGPQKAYDALFNQYIQACVNANNPIIFDESLTMRDEPRKLSSGMVYPTLNGAGIKTLQFPGPDASIHVLLELVQFWAQMLFGISEFTAGLESKIDPDAPAKKAEIVVAQGSVRMNMIIKRKLKTLKDILKRWFLLYQANLPPNKYMRVAGDSEDQPWKFDAVSISDFAMTSLPDFEITGNILNMNKSFEANKSIAIYQLLIANPFFNPQTLQGMQALHSLTKWLTDKLDEIGLSRFLPKAPGDIVTTPEEENARFLQGDDGTPLPNEDHVHHMQVHRQMLIDPSVPGTVKQPLAKHISDHAKLLRDQVTQQIVLGQAGVNPGQGQAGPQQVPQQGGFPSVQPGQPAGQGAAAGRIFSGQPAGVA
jgi:hypothetical protein